MVYNVTFTKYYEYEVEAETEREAEDEARRQFVSDMMRPVADTSYDEVEVESEDDEDDY